MKTLVVGVYRDGTGWGQACTDYILALDGAGVDVVCRPVKLNSRTPELPRRILELEKKSSRGCDAVIQHVLPHQMDYNGRLFNIGLYASETGDFSTSSWARHLNTMDRCWVINRQMVEAARKSGVTVPIDVIPHAADVARFERSYQPLDCLVKYKDEFLFYTVGEFVRRKNFAALLKAFYLEFDPSEPVRLVLKTSREGVAAPELKKQVEAFCVEVRKGLKLREHKPEIVLTHDLSGEEVMGLHAACDCFVLPSYGEAWCIPAFDAMAMGKTPIVTRATGFLDYVSDREGWLVDYREEPVFGDLDTFADIHVGSESWASVDVYHLRRCMREAYVKESTRQEKSVNGTRRAYQFSYDAVGKTMREILEKHALERRPA